MLRCRIPALHNPLCGQPPNNLFSTSHADTAYRGRTKDHRSLAARVVIILLHNAHDLHGRAYKRGKTVMTELSNNRV